jgi:hypothetical protein
MRRYRTAQGKSLDMTALAAKNERTRAVGNMKVNARGDTIDSSGKVVVPVTEKIGQTYAKTVGNKSAQLKTVPVHTNNPAPVTKTKDEEELDDLMSEDIEVEAIKLKESK